MSFLEVLSGAAAGPRDGRIYGAVIGIVTNNHDPDGMGRVRVRFPWLSDSDESAWARIAAPGAGRDRGVCFLPEVEDEVLVVFEHGDPAFPYILGGLWNGKDVPPETNAAGENSVRVIRSRAGHVIRLTDKDGGEKIEITDKAGNSVTLDGGGIVLSAAQGTIKLAARSIEIEATGVATLRGTTVNIN